MFLGDILQKCELCPSKHGALKRTDNSGWAHVVCALYIPEVRFGNVTTMEPIQLQLIPAERFNKVCIFSVYSCAFVENQQNFQVIKKIVSLGKLHLEVLINNKWTENYL